MVHLTGAYPSVMLGTEIAFDILLPKVSSVVFPGQTSVQEGSLRTLFLLHGACDSPQTLLLYTNIAALCDQYNLAVVMPGAHNSFYLDEPGGQPWNTALFEEMYDYLHQIFPLSDRREDNYIGGISMGGYGAVYTALRRPERFCRCFSLSGALDIKLGSRYVQACRVPVPRFLCDDMNALPGSSLDLLTYIRPDAHGPHCFLDLYCGKQDPFRHALTALEEACIAAGWPHDVTRGSGRHDWNYWNAHLAEAIKKLHTS